MTAAPMAGSNIPKRYSLHSLASVKTAKKNATASKGARSPAHSQHESISSTAGVDEIWPVHPIVCMRGPFQESIIEAMDPDARIRQTIDAATRRLQLLDLDAPEGEDHTSRWRKKPGAKYHPLWKLIAQISFGVHLLHQEIAKSEEEVIRILQTHVDEIDGFLEDVGADFDLAMRDIDERLRLLLLPLEHGRTFNRMLRNREFRASIIQGNDVVERICQRTKVAMDKSLEDVGHGVEATAELAKFLDRLGKEWAERDEDMQVVYTAMRGNAKGWYHAFGDIQKKGKKLKKMIRRLERIVSEIERQAGIASRRQTRKNDTAAAATTAAQSRGATPNDERPPSASKQAPGTTSPRDSRTSSSFRDSMNKPLPPDPHRRSGKEASSKTQRQSELHTHSGQSSFDMRNLLENDPLPAKSPELTPAPVEPMALHVHKPSIGLQDIINHPSSLGITIESATSGESDAEVASNIALPLSPTEAQLPKDLDSPSRGITPVSAVSGEEPSTANLVSESVPQALSPELHAPSTPRPKSQMAAKHQSSSDAEAFEQAKSPSRKTSQQATKDTGSPPPLTHTGTTASEESVHQVSAAESTAEQQTVLEVADIASQQDIPRPDRGVPARVPVGRKASEQKMGLAKEPRAPREESSQATSKDNEDNADDPAHDSSNQSFRTVQPGTHIEGENPEQITSISSEAPSTPRIASFVTAEPYNRYSEPRTRLSISSASSIAHESTAVERPQSQNTDHPVHPKRTASKQAFGPATNGFSDSDLPEIHVEPEDREPSRASNDVSLSSPTPSTPPPPEHSPARPSPRSGGRSPVSYKLLPDIQSPPPGESDPLSPKTALPQMSQSERPGRLRKSSMSKFRGMLFKKNPRPAGLGTHVEAV